MIKIIMLIMITSLFACSSTKLNDSGRKVKIEHKRSLSKKCEVMGKVVGKSSEGLFQLAKNSARNQAASKGANTIVFNEEIANGKNKVIHATIYNCP